MKITPNGNATGRKLRDVRVEHQQLDEAGQSGLSVVCEGFKGVTLEQLDNTLGVYSLDVDDMLGGLMITLSTRHAGNITIMEREIDGLAHLVVTDRRGEYSAVLPLSGE